MQIFRNSTVEKQIGGEQEVGGGSWLQRGTETRRVDGNV